MKKIFTVFLATATALASALSLPACSSKNAKVIFTLSEDGTYYVISKVEEPTRLGAYEIPSEYTDAKTGVTAPVKEIGANAFMFAALNDIKIGSSVEVIRRGAFAFCEGLRELTIPENVTVIEELAFSNCSSLETVYIKASVEDIPFGAFRNSVGSAGGQYLTNTSLKNVYISSTVKTINKDAFYGNAIKNVYFQGTQAEWNAVRYYEIVSSEGNKEVKYLDAEGWLPPSVECEVAF